jgi:hypothetical protein
MLKKSGIVSSSLQKNEIGAQAQKCKQERAHIEEEEEEENLAEFLILFDQNAAELLTSTSAHPQPHPPAPHSGAISLQTLRRKRELSDLSPTRVLHGTAKTPDKRPRHCPEGESGCASTGCEEGPAVTSPPSTSAPISVPVSASVDTASSPSSASALAASLALTTSPPSGGGKKWTEKAVEQVPTASQ